MKSTLVVVAFLVAVVLSLQAIGHSKTISASKDPVTGSWTAECGGELKNIDRQQPSVGVMRFGYSDLQAGVTPLDVTFPLNQDAKMFNQGVEGSYDFTASLKGNKVVLVGTLENVPRGEGTGTLRFFCDFRINPADDPAGLGATAANTKLDTLD